MSSRFRATMTASLLALALAPVSLRADRAERPQVKVGDLWRFAVYYSVPTTVPNRVWVVTAAAPDGIEGTENGEPLALTPELNVRESPREKYSNHQMLRFPLEVGQRWRYSTDWLFKPKSSKGTLDVEVRVVGNEPVRVPAGEFEAYKLESRGRVGGTAPIGSQYNADITITYWYAPRARAVVKSVQHNPYIGTSTLELIDFQLQP